MTELVSGWSDDERVYLIEREGDSVRYRSVPASWSLFVLGMDEKDQATLARSSNVTAIIPQGQYTRVECRGKWQRREVADWLGKAIEGRRTIGWKDPNDTTPEPALLEADVMPLRRLLSDNGHLQVSANPRLVWLDLEVDPRGTFQEMTEGRRRILVWALYKWDGEKEVKVASDVLKADHDDAERELLGALFDKLLAYDVVLSWNGQDFDFPCLENRSMKLRVKMPASGKVPIWQRWCWLDHMEVYEKYNQAHESGEERASVSLDSVSKYLLGADQGKIPFNAREGWTEWLAGGERRARFVEYCEHDTSRMPLIEAASGFVALHLAVCHVTRCFPDTNSLRATEQCDGFLLYLGATRGHRFPTKQRLDGMESFDGAYVMEPRKLGVMDGVHVCDFSGLYPSIMRTWNMSLETLVPTRMASPNVSTCKIPPREVHFRTNFRGIIPSGLDQLQAARDEYSAKADSSPKGSEEHNYYSRLSSAFKIVINSVYGITGSPFSRFYNPTIAEGVTQTGKWLIHHVAAVMEATGKLQAIYGDTDSVFARGSVEIFAQVVKSLNDCWDETAKGYGCTKSYLKLAFEKTYARFVIKGKKCYAGKYELYKGKKVGPDKNPQVRGLEYMRGDTNRLARQMQYELLKMILPDVLPQPPIPSAEEFREWVRGWRTKVLEGELELGDVVLSKSVKNLSEYAVRYTTDKCTNKVGSGKAARNCGYVFPGGKEVGDGYAEECPKCNTKRKQVAPPVHVRVAKLLAERGEQMTPGTRVEYLVVQGEGLEGESDGEKMNAVPASDPGVMERLDRDYYWDKLVFPATQRLLEVVYPTENWKDTEASRRKAKLVAEREEKKNVFTDLPLFGAPPDAPSEQSTRVDSPALVEPAASAPTPEASQKAFLRPRRAVRAAQGEAPKPLVLRIQAPSAEEYLEQKSTQLLEAIGAAVAAHPGECPLVVEVEIASPASVVRVKTDLKVSRGREAIAALQRLSGPSGLTLVQ